MNRVNATFFQPGVQSRVNPLIRKTELTAKSRSFVLYLDRTGSLYFTKENYDDFDYAVRRIRTYRLCGILWVSQFKGHLQQTANGLLSFPFMIRNQFTTALSTFEGARAQRSTLEYQRDFKQAAPGQEHTR